MNSAAISFDSAAAVLPEITADLKAANDAAESTPGRIAYEADCKDRPYYRSGVSRDAWHDISELARWSWERYAEDAE